VAADQEFGARPLIELDGTPVAEAVMPLVEEVVVDDHLHLPDMFAIRFRDDGKDVLTRTNTRVGSRIVISATAVGDGTQEPMIIVSKLSSTRTAPTPWFAATTSRIV
jgi:hypothetical protein